METPAAALDVVAAEPVLVPPVVHRPDVAGEDEQERWQRAEVVDPPPLLHGHPLLHPARVPAGAPLVDVHDHDARVEVAWAAPVEGAVERRVRPEGVREVVAEVGVAVLGRRHHVAREVHGRQRPDVVHHDHVGVEVRDAAHVARQRVGEVDARVVERLVQLLAHRPRDTVADARRVEAVHPQVEERERGAQRGGEAVAVGVGVGGEEVERYALGARRVLQDGQHRGHGAAEVVSVQRHGDVHPAVRAAVGAVPERGRLLFVVWRRWRGDTQGPKGGRPIGAAECEAG
uniref:Uncharacterized protein n=1 Tax=Zea mays TaxID=4577 RepID=C4IZX9_MAIZE|nr:unknown [Zea mays]